MRNRGYLRTETGILKIEADEMYVLSVSFVQDKEEESENGIILEAKQQLREYFAGKRRTFDLPLKAEGTPFQKQVWRAVKEIPYGQTASYAEIAERAGNAKAVRAAGRAVGRNPYLILIPCHRVIHKSGEAGNYAAGKEKKEFLLHLEAANLLQAGANRCKVKT